MASSDSADIIAIIDNVQSLSGKSCHEDTALLEPYTYIQSRPGKGIWERMIQAFDHWLKVPKPQLEIITRIVDLLHTGSLMIDDIEDNSQIRRGGPVAHKVFGIPKTLNAANLAYFMAYRELSSLKEIYSTSGCHDYPYLYKADRRPLSVILDDIVTEELICLHRGQGLELLRRDSLQCPSEAEYVRVALNKTGGLLRLTVKLMVACSTANHDLDYMRLVNLFSIFYQIRDDYANLPNAKEYTVHKGYAEDLTEGKFSFPVIHGINADPSDTRILNILQKRPSSPTLKTHAVAYLSDHTKSLEYTANTIRVLEAQIREKFASWEGITFGRRL